VKEPYPLYTPISKIDKYIITSIFIIVALIISGGIFLYFKKKKTISSNNQIDTNIEENHSADIEFNQIELELIKKLVGEQEKSKTLSVEEINSALGLSKKTLEIQKKIRTETINRINHKFKIIFNSSEELIERVRLEEDRRYYMYRINTENKKRITSAFKN
jgi:hypothetical protein